MTIDLKCKRILLDFYNNWLEHLRLFPRESGYADVGLCRGLRMYISDEFRASSSEYSYQTGPLKTTDQRKPFRLFLLDDDQQVYEYFKFLISQLNYDVELTFVQNLEDALKYISLKRFDLYLLDYDLGYGKGGLDFYRENLSFLTCEVVLHTSRDISILSDANCNYEQKPMPLGSLNHRMDELYEKRLKILLVEDSKLTQMAWEMYQGEHNIQCVDSPEEALGIIEKQEFDLYVLDYYFDNSQMNGANLGHKILEIRPDSRIVIASGTEINDKAFKTMDKTSFEVRRAF